MIPKRDMPTSPVAALTTQLQSARTMADYRTAKRAAERLGTDVVLALIDALIDARNRLDPC